MLTLTLIKQWLRELDDSTGFDTSQIPVLLTDSDSYIGAYCCDPSCESFCFSHKYFSDQAPESAMKHIVKHEYAHFLCGRIYGVCGSHGSEFEKCAEMVNYDKFLDEETRRCLNPH
jgi:hypothetical protein